MILLDSSALVCAVVEEPEAAFLKKLVTEAKSVAVGAPLALEAGMVLAGRLVDSRFALNGYLDATGVEILEFGKEHHSVALSAFLRFGKGRHPAALNFGDCISYAFAQMTQLTLVYKGADFGLTDLPRLRRLDG